MRLRNNVKVFLPLVNFQRESSSEGFLTKVNEKV